jgi:hypothetical protein
MKAKVETHDNVVHVVLLDPRGEVDVNLNAVLRVLLLDGVQEGVEPFSRTEVANDPGKVDLHTNQC